MAKLLVLAMHPVNRAMHIGDVAVAVEDWHVLGDAEEGAGADPMLCLIHTPGVPANAFRELLEPMRLNGREVLYRRMHLNLMSLGRTVTYEQVMAARMEKVIHPLLS